MLTPEICEAVLYRGEDVPFCPKMINGMMMEQNFDNNNRMRQSYIETKLFGSDVTGEIIDSLPLTKTGMKSSYQKKLDAMAAQFDVLCADKGVMVEGNTQVKVEIPYKDIYAYNVFNILPTPVTLEGETFIAGVRIILTSNLGNRSGRYCWGNIDFLDNVYSSVALFILNSAEYGIDSVTRMAKRKQIHLVYWVFDTANLSNVMFDISPNETRLAEGNEFLRKAYYKLNNTTWDATPDFDVCQRCVLKCDKRINYIRR